MTDKLPNPDAAIVEQSKILDYLLNAGHPAGAAKARYFTNRGFAAATWPDFAAALRAHGKENAVTKVTATEWGVRYQVDCHCKAPDGSSQCIRSVWEVRERHGAPRLLTAHPLAD